MSLILYIKESAILMLIFDKCVVFKFMNRRVQLLDNIPIEIIFCHNFYKNIFCYNFHRNNFLTQISNCYNEHHFDFDIKQPFSSLMSRSSKNFKEVSALQVLIVPSFLAVPLKKMQNSKQKSFILNIISGAILILIFDKYLV